MLDALSILGYGTAYNSRELVSRSQEVFAAEALHAKFGKKGKEWDIEQFESIWGEYRAISGELASCMAEECIKFYPDAKVILTVREDEEVWLASLMETMWYGSEHWLNKVLKRLDQLTWKRRKFLDPLWKYMYDGDLPTHGIRRYREHNAMVKRLCEEEGKGRLLVFDVKEGWGPLCKFLGREVPDVEFPHALRREELKVISAKSRRVAVIRVIWKAIVRSLVPVSIVAMILLKRRQIVSWMRSVLGE